MGTSCFVTVTTDFCFKSPAPLFEHSIFFLFTVKVPLFNLLAEEEEPSLTGFMSFTFDKAFPLLSERKCWAQIKDAARRHHDQLPLLPFTGDQREDSKWGSDMVTLASTP
ncbi:hypothetical protein AMTRI_Chr05g67240 [Amborella trichopoda]